MNCRNMTNDELMKAADALLDNATDGRARPLIHELAKRLEAAMDDLDREVCPFERVAEKHDIWSSDELSAVLQRVLE